MQTSSQDLLRKYVERIERLQDEQKGLGADIKDVFAEAKTMGFDVKIMRKIIALRKKSKNERQEEDAILATYMHALGMEGTPLAEWADKIEA